MYVPTRMNNDVSILSVFHSPLTKELLEINQALIARLNPGSEHQWLVGQNFEERAGALASFKEKNTRVVAGAVGYRHDVLSWLRGSYRHGEGLQTLAPLVRTRFFIILDPDFFIIRPHWIQELTHAMTTKGLSFFGAPFNPKRFPLYRYFPSVNFMAIDSSRVDKSSLDFSPGYRGQEKEKHAWLFQRRMKILLGGRAGIGKRRETGFYIYRQYHDTHTNECIQPVFSQKPGWLDRILPEQLSHVPHKKGYSTSQGFNHYGFPDLRSEFGWEEYIYHDAPYAFHMQGGKEEKNMTQAMAVRQILQRIRL